jgi:hypothetical protein
MNRKTKKAAELDRLARVRREFDTYSPSIRLTEPEAAAVLGQSPATLKFWRLNRPGKGPEATKANGSVRYTVEAIRTYQHAGAAQ